MRSHGFTPGMSYSWPDPNPDSEWETSWPPFKGAGPAIIHGLCQTWISLGVLHVGV